MRFKAPRYPRPPSLPAIVCVCVCVCVTVSGRDDRAIGGVLCYAVGGAVGDGVVPLTLFCLIAFLILLAP